jgi:ketosteroid isomerase-like protein
MSNEEENVQVVKNFFAAIGSGDKQALLALVDEGMEWIIPGEDWPLAGTHRGHAGVAAVLRKAAEEIETTYPKPPEFVAQGGRVLVVGVATGKIKATTKTFKDDWVFDITVRNGKPTEPLGDIVCLVCLLECSVVVRVMREDRTRQSNNNWLSKSLHECLLRQRATDTTVTILKRVDIASNSDATSD